MIPKTKKTNRVDIQGQCSGRRRGAGIILAIFSFLFLLGGVCSAQTPSGPMFAYAANASSSNISAYAIDGTTGALTPVAGSPFATGPSPFAAAVDSSGRFVYVAACGSPCISSPGQVWAYTIDNTTGALTPVAGSPFAAGRFPHSVAVEPSGKFVYVANTCGDATCDTSIPGSISAYTIDKTTGALTPVAGSPFATGRFPLSVAVDPTGKFAYVANANSSGVWAYAIDGTTGALTPIAGSPFGTSGISSVVVDPSDRFAFGTNLFGVLAYAVDSTTGALTAVSGSPFSAGVWTYSNAALDPSGKFLYAASCGDSPCTYTVPGSISAFSVNTTTGALSPVQGSPFAAGLENLSLAVDPTGRFVYATDGGRSTTGKIWAYAIDSTTGALSPLAGSPFPAGAGAMSIAVARPANTPQQATQAIATQVNDLLGQGMINSGQNNSLGTKLQNAIAMINGGKINGAIGKLEAFINEVNALENSRRLTGTQGSALTSAATSVIQQLQAM